jgi:hypothetical protein
VRVLVACEMSGRVREAFRKKGHDAWSCDILPSLDDSQYHVVGDARTLLDNGWDLLIAHPPCTYLCNSGVRWLHNQYHGNDQAEFDTEFYRVMARHKNMWDARALFMSFWESSIPKICIENPVPHKYAELPKYSQTIQPYQFGEDASKRTCLWLKGLPLITPTQLVSPSKPGKNGKLVYANQTPSGQNKEGPSDQRGALRSLTYQGIAAAFADQWG